jgi:hypothetical protein
MRRWLVILFLAGVFVFPYSVRAQSPIKLSSLQVQLWPEYDQPSMLVIYDFKLPDGIKLPVNISMSFPKDAHLVAVASQAADGSLLNTDYVGPSVGETWQTVTVQIQTQATYHLEYYEPIPRSGKLRQFTYLWPGDYAADNFSISVRIPVDTTNIVTNPAIKSSKKADGANYLFKEFGPLGAGQQFPLHINYTKTSDTLDVTQENIQPSEPLSSTTPGRVMLSNYFPYIAVVLGVILIAGGSIYFWQSSRDRQPGGRRRHMARGDNQAMSDVYCHQCGTRAQLGDRFCRVCGTKLRL